MSLNQICHDDEKYFLWKNMIHIKQYANKFAYSYLQVVHKIIVTILNWFSQFLEERSVGNVDFYLLRLVC
jgi:hypothetical protein